MSLYKMMIANTSRYLRSLPVARQSDSSTFDAFTAAQVLAVALAKDQDAILNDLLQAALVETKTS